MVRLLLDSSILIDFLRKTNKNDSIFAGLLKQNPEFCISMISHTEIFSGKSVWETRKARKDLEELFSGIYIIPFSLKISELAGKLHMIYRIDLLDCIIAATALEQNIPIATLNIKDFKMIKGLKIHN